MPVIFIYGLPESMKDDVIEELYERLLTAVLEIKELNLQSHQVTLFFPSDRMKMGLGEEIVIFVKGLIDKSERTFELRQKLAESLRKTTQSFFPKTKLVECFIEPFSLRKGFSSSNP